MKLLEKTRQINKLLQQSDKLNFSAIASLLSLLIEANTYVVGSNGEIRGYAITEKFKCPVMDREVLEKSSFPNAFTGYIMSLRSTIVNIPCDESECYFTEEDKCPMHSKITAVIPIYGNNRRLGTLLLNREANEFSEEDILFAEYAATVIGFELLHELQALQEEENRKMFMVKIALSTLSYSEIEAVINILGELDGCEGLLIASKVADRVGITRSVIVNALRKLESADLISTRSLGMKGTYIKVKNTYLLENLPKK